MQVHPLDRLRQQLLTLRTWRGAPWHWVCGRSSTDKVVVFEIFRQRPEATRAWAHLRSALPRTRPIRGRIAARGGCYLLRTADFDAPRLRQVLSQPITNLGLLNLDPWLARGNVLLLDEVGDPGDPDTWLPPAPPAPPARWAGTRQATADADAGLDALEPPPLPGMDALEPPPLPGLDALAPPPLPGAAALDDLDGLAEPDTLGALLALPEVE